MLTQSDAAFIDHAQAPAPFATGDGMPAGRPGRLREWLARSPGAVLAGGIATVSALGVVDWATGPDLAFSVFYLLPVSAVAWASSLRRSGAMAAVSAIVWGAADITAGAGYSNLVVPVWNSAARFSVFMIVALLLTNLQRAIEREQALARTDALTGVASSRWFSEQVAVLGRRATGEALTLMYIDLDDFKAINDRHGHGGGDEVLRRVGAALRHVVRSTDLVGRMGGDEFTVAFSRTVDSDHSAEVRSIVARITGALSAVEPPVAFSAGAVTFAPVPSIDDAITAADRLMYEVKRNGKRGFTHQLNVSPS